MKRTTVFKGGRLINGTGAEPIDDSVVAIRDGKIAFAGNKEQAVPFDNVIVIDIQGKTIMPGLMDAHTHCSWDGDVSIPAGIMKDFFAKRVLMAYRNFRTTIEAGITTVREMGAHGFIDIAVRDLINDGSFQGPRIVAAGKGLTQTGGHGALCSGPPWIQVAMGHIAEVVDGEVECKKAIRRQVEMGCDFIKIWATSGLYDASTGKPRREFCDDELKIIVREAHLMGREVAAHAHTPEAIIACLEAGVRSIEHGMFIDEKALELMVAKEAFWVPTTAIYHNFANGAGKGVLSSAVENSTRALEVQARAMEMAVKMGVKIVMGTDAGAPLTYHGNNAVELELMNERGLSTMDCIVASTRRAAELFGISEKVGTIEDGKIADIIVVDGNPLEDIRSLQNKENIVLIMREGEIFKNELSA
jgi:imidazolonepropionase-like amidohydrolase